MASTSRKLLNNAKSMIPPVSSYAPILTLPSHKENIHNNYIVHSHFFLPFDLPFGAGAGLEAVDMTLEAREEGAADVALLPAADLTLSRALFCRELVFAEASREIIIP